MADTEYEALIVGDFEGLSGQPEGYRLLELVLFLGNLINKTGNK
jgi:hypothetical protein